MCPTLMSPKEFWESLANADSPTILRTIDVLLLANSAPCHLPGCSCSLTHYSPDTLNPEMECVDKEDHLPSGPAARVESCCGCSLPLLLPGGPLFCDLHLYPAPLFCNFGQAQVQAVSTF